MTMDVAACLDPEIGAALSASPLGAFDFASVGLEGIPQIREMMANMPVVELPATTTVSHEVVVPAVDGGPDPTVRVYSPPTKTDGRPCIYWIHGGGYLFGSGLTVDARINRWVEELDCVAVSIEYRLAPEDPYPAPLDDCYAGLLWAARNADELGIDPANIAIVGASAGGGLAAGLAIRARDRGEVAPAFQLLIYPMIDDTNTTPSSRIDGALVWSRGANEMGWSAYLGSRSGTDDVPGEAAASRVPDVAGLPPAWIGVGSLDVFRDEDLAYASRLLAAGITTEVHVYPGAPHGFEMMAPGAAIAQACQRDITEALRRALRPALREPSVGASTS
jgi:acetyl esterase/lipase